MKLSYYKGGPKATKLLAKRIRKKQTSQSVYKILDPKTGQTYSNLEDIDRAFQSYYKTQYSQPNQDSKENIKTFLNSLDLPSIGEKQNNFLSSQITKKNLKLHLAN